MANPITIVVTAQTAEAAAKLKDFVAQANSELSTLNKGVGESATKAAGAMYGLRSSIDAIRFAAMDGGFRALFYAGDEATRALVAAGVSMSRLIPIVSVVAAAVGAGALVWKEWNAATDEVAEKTQKLLGNFKELPPLLKQIADLQKTGFLSPSAAAEFSDMLAHPGNYFVGENGQITKSPTRKVHHDEEFVGGGQFGGGQIIPASDEEIKNTPASLSDVEKYLKTSTPIQQIPPEQTAAIEANQKLAREATEALMSPDDKTIAEIQDKWNEKLEAFVQNSKVEFAKLADNSKSWKDVLLGAEPVPPGTVSMDTPAKLQASQQQYQQLLAAQNAEIAQAQQEQQNKHRQQNLSDFAAASKKIDDTITAEAAESGRTRESYYQEEYTMRLASAKEFALAGKLTEADYDEAIKKAATDSLIAQRRYNAELQKNENLQLEIQRANAEANLRATQQNPLLSDSEKADQSQPAILSLMKINALDIEHQKNVAQTTTDMVDQKNALQEMNRLTQQQSQLEQQLAAAQGENSVGYQFKLSVIQLQNMTQLSHVAAQQFTDVWRTAFGSISQNLTQLIMGTETWRMALARVGQTILESIVSGIVNMFVTWLEQMALMEIANIVGADKSSFLAAQAASSWAPAAVAAAIGSYGAAAYIGTAATQAGMLSTTALAVGLSGRASGGPVSSGMPYIVGEKGHELFVPDRDGTIIPNHQLQSYMGGGGGGGGISKNEMHLHLANFLDKDEMARHTFRSKHADVWFNDMMRKNVSRYKRTT